MPATLEWGVGPDGSLVFASSMVGVDPRDRPRVTCPECDDVVTFKAGERGLVVPHVAHRSGAACAATNPETAAHFNAKMRLARVVGPRGVLRLRMRCDFGHAVEADWHVPAWQRAEPEFRVDTRRPDVALFGEGDAVVGAVEVLHTHRVDRRKASDYAANGVPWVEFRAADVLAWDGDAALPVEACDRDTLRALAKVCRSCAAMYRPAEDALSPDEIARQAAKFREALRAIDPPRPAPQPAPTPEELHDMRNYNELFNDRMADSERREREGDRPTLNVVVAYMKGREHIAVGAVVAREGAVPSVKIVETFYTVDAQEAAWLAAEYAMELVEGRAKRPTSVWVPAMDIREANAPPHPLAPNDILHQLKARVIRAVNRNGSLVCFDAYAAGLSGWFATAQQACREALAARPRGDR